MKSRFDMTHCELCARDSLIGVIVAAIVTAAIIGGVLWWLL